MSTSTTATGRMAKSVKLPELEAGVITDLRPDEFLFPGSKVTIRTTASMDKVMSLRSIGVAKSDGAVKFSADTT
ncbi:MAG: hypothetical protein ACRDJ2_14315, partial [Actinomycetota bacterium]